MTIIFRGKYLFSLIQAGFIFSVCLFLPNISIAEVFKVIVIPSSDSIIYTRTIDNIKETTSNNNMSVNIIPLSDIDNKSISIPDDTDLLVPVGQLALDKTIERYAAYPILATLVSRLGFNEILKKNKATRKDTNVGAIFLDQPLERYLAFTRLVLPKNKKLGFLMSKEYRELLTEFGSITRKYSYHIEIYNKGDNLIQSLNRVMENADVIVALPDTTVFNRRNTHNILLSTYRKLIPLIGFSGSYIKAGALTGIHSTPDLIGKQTGELIESLSSKGFIGKLPVLHAKYFQITVNNKVARSLGLTPLNDDTLRHQMLNTEVNRDD